MVEWMAPDHELLGFGRMTILKQARGPCPAYKGIQIVNKQLIFFQKCQQTAVIADILLNDQKEPYFPFLQKCKKTADFSQV